MDRFDIKDACLSVEHDPQGRFWNSKWNLHRDVLEQYNLPKRVTITDSTVREGGEVPHVVYKMEDKLRITRLLDEMNVHEIDCGFASTSQGDLDFLKHLDAEKLKIKKSVVARIEVPDYKQGIDRVVNANADIVICALYAHLTPIPESGRAEYCQRVKDAVSHCKRSGVFTSFWVPCTNWEETFVLDIYGAAVDGGADGIKTAGGGYLTVPAYKRMVKLLKGISKDIELGIHVHNNYGLATACTLAAVEAGASNVGTSVNGLSHGSGLAAFEEVVMALTVLYGFDLGIKIERIMELSRLVQEITGIKVPLHKPIVGESVFPETPEKRPRLEKRKAQTFIEPEVIGQR